MVKTGLTAAQIAALLSTGTQTAAGLLQQQTSKEAAVKAQAMIDAETAAAKTAAQFRPIGMTTRFGTSQFAVDPVTGQLTSAGYTLSPEAKNAQDRFLTLAGQGLTQAEGAQEAFKPLQTGATNLFTLGNKYLAQTPQDVAKNYLAEQMALLQPGREVEFANLQTKLRNQGRLGLSVAQGGTMGATTPELQALFNARARQEAELAANAQQLGQRDVCLVRVYWVKAHKLWVNTMVVSNKPMLHLQVLLDRCKPWRVRLNNPSKWVLVLVNKRLKRVLT